MAAERDATDRYVAAFLASRRGRRVRGPDHRRDPLWPVRAAEGDRRRRPGAGLQPGRRILHPRRPRPRPGRRAHRPPLAAGRAGQRAAARGDADHRRAAVRDAERARTAPARSDAAEAGRAAARRPPRRPQEGTLGLGERRRRRLESLAAQELRQVGDGLGEVQDLLLPQLVDLLVQQLDLELGLDVDLAVVLGLLAVDVLLAVLAHHDDRRRVGGLERQREVQQDEGIGVPLLDVGGHVQHDPDEQDRRLDDDEAPRSHGGGHRVGHPLAQRQLMGLRRSGAGPQVAAQDPKLGQQPLLRRMQVVLQRIDRTHTRSSGRGPRRRGRVNPLRARTLGVEPDFLSGRAAPGQAMMSSWPPGLQDKLADWPVAPGVAAEVDALGPAAPLFPLTPASLPPKITAGLWVDPAAPLAPVAPAPFLSRAARPSLRIGRIDVLLGVGDVRAVPADVAVHIDRRRILPADRHGCSPSSTRNNIRR